MAPRPNTEALGALRMYSTTSAGLDAERHLMTAGEPFSFTTSPTTKSLNRFSVSSMTTIVSETTMAEQLSSENWWFWLKPSPR